MIKEICCYTLIGVNRFSVCSLNCNSRTFSQAGDNETPSLPIIAGQPEFKKRVKK